MDFLTTLLNDACPADGPDANGWSTYYVANHCSDYWVTARVAARDPMTNAPTAWEVRDWTYQ